MKKERKKPIVATNKQTGEQIIFDSMQDVANFFHVGSPTVTRWCKKLRNPSVNYNFDYLSTNND